MKKYKTPAGNTFSEEELRSKYGDQFDSLVSAGTLTLVEGVEDEKKNPNPTSFSGSDSSVLEKDLVFDTNEEKPNGSSVGSEVIEEEIDLDFDETLPENQQTLLENQSNIDILNSVGFLDSNKPQMETLDAVKLLASKGKGTQLGTQPEQVYQIKDPETGKFSSKKESEIPENVLKAIKLYEKAYPKTAKKEEVLLAEEDYSNPDTINTEILIKNNVNQDDYLRWEKKNTRQEGSVYKFFKKLLPTDEGNQYELEKRQYEKLQSYNASKLNTITSKLSANEAAQSLSTNPEEIKQLKKEASLLKKDFMNTYSSLESAIESFPTYKDKTVDDELERRKDLYNSFKKGGGAELSAGGIELLKTAGTAVTSFATDFAGGIPGMIDQRLTTFGYDKKGFLSGLSEMITDSGDALEREVGELKRPAFLEGKPVTFEGEEFVVDGNGTVYDSNSNIRMEGILSEEKIKSIIKRSKDVPNTVINWTGGSVATGGVNTIVNLVALIRTAGKVKNATGLDKVFKPGTAGKVSMGLTSFTSGVVKNVDDIRSQLMATGMSEKEAMDIAVNAGQAISTLDGIFSGLAGSNEGLLIGFQTIKDQIKNLAIKEGKSFAKKQFKDKLGALVKENMKELFVEELPVYFSEKGINYLVNQKIGNEVLDQKITKAGVIETAVMTIGATSTLGGRKLLTGNKRKDLVRTLATDVNDLKKTLDVLINEGSLSKEEAANAYSEIYNMQAAELKTKGTIKMSQNVEEAADLLAQRQKLIEQKEGLEGPLKEEIDKRIEDVDTQIKKLQERDVTEAQSIVDGEKDGQRTVEVTREEALEALKAENEVRLKSKLPAILESKANIIKKQDELIKDKQDAIQEKITLEELNKPDTFTHRTMSKDAITNWADGGQVIGKKEDLKDFDSRVPNNPLEAASKKEGFNRQSPNFQKGGVYSGKVKPGEFVVVTKGDNKFIPSASFQNRKTFEKSSGISTLKPDSRQLSNFDLYKVNEKGELIKQNWNNYKTNKDAIQKSSTEGVDVQKQSRDGQEMGEGDTQGAVANETNQETKGEAQVETQAEVRERIDQPYLAGNTEVRFNADGTVNKILKKGTKSPAGKAAQSKAEKNVLKNKIDVNAGKRFVPETDNLTPQEYDKEVAENSTNIRQISESIKTETENSKTLSEQQKIEQLDPQNILSIDVSEADFNRYGDPKLITPQIRKKWFKKPKKNETIKNDLDTVVMETPGLEVEAVIDFIVKNPNRKVDTQKGKSETLTELEKRFKELTGINPTPSNINTVVSINPDAEPLSVVEQRNKKSVLNQKEPVGNKRGSKNPKKILGDNKPKKVTVDEKVALKNQIKLEVKAAKDSKKDQTTRRRSLTNAIKSLFKKGDIKNQKAISLIKKISNVNLNNAKKVQDVIDFVEKAMNDSSYSDKVSKANTLVKSIKKNLKGKEASLSDAAKQFALVNPNVVSDIDAYLEMAQSIKDGLMKTKKTGKGLKAAKPFDVKKVNSYSKKQTDLQKERDYKLAKESFELLTGLEPGELTLDQLKEALYEIDGREMSPEAREKLVKDKEAAIDKAIKNAFQNAKINIKGSIEDGDLEMNKEKKELIRDFLNMDLKLLNTSQKMDVLDSIINFEINQSTGRMQAILSQYIGNKGMFTLVKENIKSSLNSRWLGRLWNREISTLPNVFELMFASQSKARKVKNLLGLDGVINGSSRGEKDAAVVEQDYANAFAKKKMKSGIYFDEQNDLERGVLAEMRRFTPGTDAEQKIEFDKSKKLIVETYERLQATKDLKDKQKGDAIQKAYEKLVKDSNTIQEVESKADPSNLEGVEYITQVWSNKYTDLADTSLNVYNKNLGKDINYTPRSVQSISEIPETPDITQPVFNPEGSSKSVYDKKTGVLKEATKPKTLEAGKILNLGFDRQNLSNYKAALTDIYTAPSIQQIKGARESKAYKEVFPNDNARIVMEDRINNYVDAKRGKKFFNKKNEATLGFINKVATFGVVKALGGLTQPIKQIVPIFNTTTNAGILNTIEGVRLINFNKEANKAIDKSGLAIANRGIKAQSDLESVDTRIDNVTRTKAGKIINALDSANKYVLEKSLVNPDVATARASFLAYYLQAMDKKGVSSNEIDWSKPLEKEAAQYAQQQVDRQQNTSDQDLQGELFTSQKLLPQMARKTLFPFANFLLNQKTRMYSDINTLYRNPTALPGDKKAAAKSLAGLGVESVMFNAIGLGISSVLSNLVSSLIGEDEDEDYEKRIEKEKKRFKNQLTGRAGNMAADIISPVPFMNDFLLSQANSLLAIMQEGEEDPFKFFAKNEKDLSEQLGVLGIGGAKALMLIELIMMAQSGNATTTYRGQTSTKKLTKDAQDKASTVAAIYGLYLTGALPLSEVGYLSERALKELKKRKEPKPKKFKEEKKENLSLSSKSKLQGGTLKSKSKLFSKRKL